MPNDDIGSVIAHQQWLGPVEEKLQNALHQAFANGGPSALRVKSFLNGSWIGEPLHVQLKDVPLGAWITALIFDLLEVASNRREFAVAADSAVLIGLIGAVGAAVTGLADWQDVDLPARRVGLVHGLLNGGAALLFGASFAMRKKHSRAAGRYLAASGFAIAAFAARLGGKLVYEHQVGVDHAPAQRLTTEFVPVLAESELPEGHSKRIEYEGLPILLVRRKEQISALADTCSHLGGPLSEGTCDETSVTCPWHGSRFALSDGRVLDGPAVHPQPCFETRRLNGNIEIRSSPEDAQTRRRT